MNDDSKIEPWEKEYRNTDSPAGRETGKSSTLGYFLGGCGLAVLILIGIVFCLFAVCLALVSFA